jgi:hypothetical protein
MLDRFLQEKAPELDGVFSTSSLMGLKSWRVTKYGQTLKLGKIHYTHDLGKSGKGAALHALQSYQGNAIIGHTHRMEVYYQGNARGEHHVGASFGWLGNFGDIDYRHSHMAKREWSHGFGVVSTHKSGIANVQAVPIVNGGCCVNGKHF